MWKLESELTPPYLSRQNMDELAYLQYTTFCRAKGAGDLPAAYDAIKKLSANQSSPDEINAYFLANQYTIERNLQLVGAANATADRMLLKHGDNPRIVFLTSLDWAQMMAQTGRGKDGFLPTFAQTERYFTDIFAQYTPYHSAIVDMHMEFANFAMDEASRDPLMRHYATVAVNHLEEASSILNQIEKNPALTDDKDLIQSLPRAKKSVDELLARYSARAKEILKEDSSVSAEQLERNIQASPSRLRQDVPLSASETRAAVEARIAVAAHQDFSSLPDKDVIALSWKVTGTDEAKNYAKGYGPAALPGLIRVFERPDLSAREELSLGVWIGGYQTPEAAKALLTKLDKIKYPALLSEEEWNALSSIVVALGNTAQPAALAKLREMMAEDYWTKHEPQYQVPEWGMTETIATLRHLALDAYALSATKEALDDLSTGRNIPADLAPALPELARMCNALLNEENPYPNEHPVKGKK
jgi:hypothetical protein